MSWKNILKAWDDPEEVRARKINRENTNRKIREADEFWEKNKDKEEVERICRVCKKPFMAKQREYWPGEFHFEDWCLECQRNQMMEDEAHNVSEGYDEMDDV